MSCRTKLKTFSTTVACAAMAIAGVVSPAIAQDRTAWLQDNQSTTMTGYFVQGESIYASCDEDCNDINMVLYNEMGVAVAADDGIDAAPIVTAPYEGTFLIEVSMPSCTHGIGCGVSVSSDYGF